MLFPLIGPRLHGWLDDLVALLYLAGALLLQLTGAAAALACGGAAVHFLLTRFTDYPQGTWKRIPFRTHAVIELGEGLLLLAGTWALTAASPLPVRLFLGGMGLSQLVAFGFSDYGPRLPDRPAGK
jgi:4-hydroxybenzoate polyprenyltransferase